MQPIISIVGKSGVGKTTLIEKLISALLKRGYRVAAVKHGPHDFDMDREGKDTWRYTKAGACAVIISSPRKIALIKQLTEEISPAKLGDLYLDDMDIIIAEGYKKETIPKIEVLGKGGQEELLCGKEDLLLAVASDVTTLDIDFPIFDVNDTSSICEFVVREIIQKKREPSGVVLRVNDWTVPLNRFVKEMFKQVFTAMISTLKLKKVDAPKKLELIIDLKETNQGETFVKRK